VRFSEPSRSHLPLGYWVEVEIDYKIVGAGGARIWAEPWSGGSRVASCTWMPSSPIPAGSGTLTRGFDVNGTDVVDQVRVYMIDVDTVTLVQEIFLPLALFYDDYAVFHIDMSAGNPSWIRHGERLDINFDYATSYTGDLRITARPYNDGALCSGYSARPSPLYLMGAGAGTGWFTFGSAAEVDQERFTMEDPTTHNVVFTVVR